MTITDTTNDAYGTSSVVHDVRIRSTMSRSPRRGSFVRSSPAPRRATSCSAATTTTSTIASRRTLNATAISTPATASCVCGARTRSDERCTRSNHQITTAIAAKYAYSLSS